MKKTIVASLAVAATFAISAPASAVTSCTTTCITIENIGVLNNVPGDSQAVFDGIPSAPQTYNGVVTPFGTFNQNGATFSGDAMLMQNGPLGDQPSQGLYAQPLHDTSVYLTVMPAGPKESIDLHGTFFRFGLYWGSMDDYNSITFLRGTTVVETLTGSQVAGVVPAPASGDQVGDQNNRYVELTLVGDDLGFDNIILTSTTNSFEVDNLSWGPAREIQPTPLPGALALFVSGLGGLGFLRFWRKKKQTLKMAAA